MHDITFQCSQCRGKLVVRKSAAGQRTHCPHCAAQIVIPGPAEPVVAGAQRSGTLASTQRIAARADELTPVHHVSLVTTQKIVVDPRVANRDAVAISARPPNAPPPKLGFSDLIQNLQRENEELRRQLAARVPVAPAVPAVPPGTDQLRRLAAESEARKRELEAVRQRLEAERRRADDAVRSAQQLATMFEGLNTRAVQAQSLADARERTIADLLTELNDSAAFRARAHSAEATSASLALDVAAHSRTLQQTRAELDAVTRQRDLAGADAAWAQQRIAELERQLDQSAEKSRAPEKPGMSSVEKTMLTAALAEVEDRARKLQAERDEMSRAALRADTLEQENAFLREQLEFASAVSLDIQRSRELVEELTAQNKALQQTVRALTLDAKRLPTDEMPKTSA